GKMEARIIDQNNEAIALLDVYPLSAGHILVVTRSHSSKIQELGPEDMISLFGLVSKMAMVLEISLNVKATLIAIHNGREAGQEINHVHVHVIPRSNDDGAGPVHSMFKDRIFLDENEMDKIMFKIKNHV